MLEDDGGNQLMHFAADSALEAWEQLVDYAGINTFYRMSADIEDIQELLVDHAFRMTNNVLDNIDINIEDD